MLHPCTVLETRNEKYLSLIAVSHFLSDLIIFIATPGPGTYVAPSSFGYMLNSEQILAMSGVDLSPKLRDKLTYNQSSTNKSRRNSYSRHSNGLS